MYIIIYYYIYYYILHNYYIILQYITLYYIKLYKLCKNCVNKLMYCVILQHKHGMKLN